MDKNGADDDIVYAHGLIGDASKENDILICERIHYHYSWLAPAVFDACNVAVHCSAGEQVCAPVRVRKVGVQEAQKKRCVVKTNVLRGLEFLLHLCLSFCVISLCILLGWEILLFTDIPKFIKHIELECLMRM